MKRVDTALRAILAAVERTPGVQTPSSSAELPLTLTWPLYAGGRVLALDVGTSKCGVAVSMA